MSNRQPTNHSVTWKQVAAFRLGRHHLLERAPKKNLVAVVRDMGGAQAQLLSAAQMSLWTRLQDLEIKDVEAAMNKRQLVKASCMRRTLFLVPAKDLATFVRGTTGRAEREIHWTRGKGVPDKVIDAAIEATLSVLDEPRTRTEIAELACRVLGVDVQSYQGGGWGSQRKLAAVPVGHLNYPVVDLLHLTATRGVVCYGPPRGSEPTFVRGDAWVPKWRDVSREEAENRLLHWYLRAFGPATAEDFSMWTGISFRAARQVLDREQRDLISVEVEGRPAALLRKDLDELMQAKLEGPRVRLLPYFDSYLLGHWEREHLAAAQHRPSIYRPQGWIAPVVLVDGRAVGVWEQARESDRLRIKVRGFGPISRRVISGIRAEAQNLSRFLGLSSAEVNIA